MVSGKRLVPPAPSPLVLIHQKSRVRYPLYQGDLVIGRSIGNLIFDHDPKLSSKHCLIRASGAGFAIYDLKSRTGILINGAPLPEGKACVLKVGAHFTVGDQVFLVDKERRLKARGNGWLAQIDPRYGALALLLLLSAGLTLRWSAHQRQPPGGQSASLASQAPPVDSELGEAMLHYAQLSQALRENSISQPQSLETIRADLIPRFARVSAHLKAHPPSAIEGAKRTELQRRTADAFQGQLTAMANYIETRDLRFSDELNAYNITLTQLTEEMRKSGEWRKPTSTR